MPLEAPGDARHGRWFAAAAGTPVGLEAHSASLPVGASCCGDGRGGGIKSAMRRRRPGHGGRPRRVQASTSAVASSP
uniref:Uncharacterized protein n=1 Tax=Arundo donax TaxID=35708 RepID=A0A0A9BKD2_ARUDO